MPSEFRGVSDPYGASTPHLDEALLVAATLASGGAAAALGAGDGVEDAVHHLVDERHERDARKERAGGERVRGGGGVLLGKVPAAVGASVSM